MTLPRFNSGAVGRLTFEHVNEICDVVERLKPLLQLRPELFATPESPVIFARITGSTTFGDHQWVEVVPKAKGDTRFATQWEDRPGGRRSNPAYPPEFYQPAFAIYPMSFEGAASEIVRYANGAVVALKQITGTDGKSCWMILTGEIEFGCVAKITGNTQIPNSELRWQYRWDEVIPDPINPSAGWTQKPGGRRGGTGIPGDYPHAQNGTEWTGLSGWAEPADVTRRLPIPTGTIVVLQLSPVPIFALTNGLAVTCPEPTP